MNGKRYLGLFFLIVMLFTACSFRILPEPKHYIRTEHKEWAKQIGLYSTENVKVSCSDNDYYGVSVSLEYDNGLVGYKELCEVINAHNKFVDENPDYYTPYIKIYFYNEPGGSNPDVSYFFNTEAQFEWINEYLKELGRPDTAKIQYMFIDMERANTELDASSDIELDVPVVIMKCHNDKYSPRGGSYEFLSEFKHAEQVIIDYFESPDYNKDEICKEIREYLPNVEIYAVESNDGKYHLEKCR